MTRMKDPSDEETAARLKGGGHKIMIEGSVVHARDK